MGRSRAGGTGDYELKATFTATADTRGLDAMENKIAALEKRMKRFSRMSATATVNEKGADAVDKKLKNIGRQIMNVSNTEANVRVGSEGDDAVERKLTNLERHANEMTRRAYKMKFEAQTEQDQAKVENLGRTADNITRFARTLRIVAQQTGFDAVGQMVDKLDQKVDELSRDRATIHADMRGYNEIMQRMNTIRRNVTELTSRPWDMEIDGDASSAQRTIAQIAAQARAQFSSAYELEVRAETYGFEDAAAKAAALKREALSLAQTRARLSVELQGVSPAIAGLISVKRSAEDAEGTYRISIDYSRIAGAISQLGVLGSAMRVVGGAAGMLGGAFRNAQGGMGMFIRIMQAGMAVVMGLGAALATMAIVSAGPLVAGFTIAAGAVATFVGGLGLVAAVAAPVISSLSNFEQNTKKVESTQKAATASSKALAQAEQQLAKANQGVSKAYASGEKAIASAIKTHEDAVRGVDKARRAYDQALQGVQEAERQGEEQIASAVRAHQQAVEAVGDAHRAVDKAVQAYSDAQIDAQEGVRQAVKSHNDAVRALDDSYRAYDRAAQAYADAQADAQEQVASAVDAHNDAVKALSYAQQDYALSAQESKDAQEELTRATEDYNDALATEEQRLLGLRYDLEGLGINQRQLALDIAEAAKDIRTAENSEERARAALRYEELLLRQKQGVLSIEEAQRRLQEAQTEGTSQLQSAYDAQQGAIKGVDNALRSEQKAADSVNDAYDAVGKTAAGITKAQLEGARSVQDAQEGLADAVRGIQDAQERVGETSAGIAQAQLDGARKVQDAQEGIADAQRALTRAIEDEGLAQANIGKARDDAARTMAQAQERVLDAQMAIQDAMRQEAEAAQGIADARLAADEQVADALQAVADAQRQVADAAEANRLAQNALNEALSDLPTEDILALRNAWIALWDDFKARTAGARAELVQFATEIAHMASAGGAVGHLADAANASTRMLIAGFRDVISMWQNTGVFTNIIDILSYIPGITYNITRGLGGIFGGLINVLAVAMPFVSTFAQYISEIGYRFAAWSNSAEGRAQLTRFFESAAIVLPVLWGFIYDIGAALVNWSTQNPQEVLMIVQALGGVVSGVFWLVASLVQGLVAMETAVPGISKVLGAIIALSFGILLIPKFIRTALFDFAKFTKGVVVGGEAAGGAFGKLGTRIAGVGRYLWGLVPILGGMTAPIWVVIAAVAALAAAAYLIYQNWDWIGPYFWSLWDGIVSVASSAWSYISADIYAAGTAIWTFLTTQWGTIQTWWSQLMGIFGIDASLSWSGIYNAIAWAVSGIGSLLSAFGTWMVPLFKLAWDQLAGIVRGVWSIISGIVSGALQIILGTIMFFAGVLTFNWDAVWQGLGWVVSGFGTAIVGIVTGIFTILGSIFYAQLAALEYMTGINFTAIYDWIAWALNGVWSVIVSIFSAIWTYLFGGSIIPDIVNAFYNAFWGIYSTIATVLDWIYNIIYTIWYGIWSTVDAVLYGISATNDYIWNGIWSTLSIILSGIWDMLSTIFWGMYDTVVAVWDWVFGDTDATWTDLWNTLSAIWSGVFSELSDIFWAMWDAIVYVWTGVWDNTSETWNAIWTFLGDTWSGIYDTTAGWLSDLGSYMYDAWYGMWEGVKEFGRWIGDTIYSAFESAVHYALDFLGKLAQGAADILWWLPGTEDVQTGLTNFAASVDYFAEGGIKYAEEGGITTRDRGGIGTDHPHDQVVVWNEQMGNEAWIAENGPLARNLGYLSQAASWFDMAVVPSQHVAGPAHTSHHKEENNKQVRPPDFFSLAGGAGTGDKKTMMKYGGIMYAAHGDTLPWGSGLTSETADTASKLWEKNDYGSLYYNSYYGHPDGYPEREAYSVDWWDSYRGGQLPISTGDDIVSQAPGYPNFSYWIWNGADSYDGSIAADDPHTDHAHTTFMPGLDLGSGGGGGGAFRLWIMGLIDQLIPDFPDLGDGVPAEIATGLGQMVRDKAVAFIMSKIPAGGAGSTEEVREWVEAGIKYGNAFEASDTNIELLSARAMQESTGNPHAINMDDANAQAGTPSKGLMQVIEPTWESMRSMYGEDTGAFESYWMDPIMSVASGSRWMQYRHQGPVGWTGAGYARGGLAMGPHLGMVGEGGNELMVPLDDPNAVNLLSKVFSQADPVRNRATEFASVQREERDNIITAGVDNMVDVGISSGEALIAEKIDTMKDEIKDEIVASFSETELGDATLDRMVKTAVATALAVVSSRGARDLIDESIGSKLEFDTDMS